MHREQLTVLNVVILLEITSNYSGFEIFKIIVKILSLQWNLKTMFFCIILNDETVILFIENYDKMYYVNLIYFILVTK